MDHRTPPLSASDATTLGRLKQLWRDRYFINFVDGKWSAWRLGNAVHRIEADTGEALRELISQDSQAWAAEARKHQ